ncbi:glycosyltransferase, group 2 family protein, partial [[Clostridium] methylpentosum DSM 5476]
VEKVSCGIPFLSILKILGGAIKMKNGTVSVIIPCYNYGAFLGEAIESVLAQTLKPIEILIVDDASSDNTQQVGLAYQKKYPGFITFHRNEKNMGIVDNFNNAVPMTSGEYICFLGADNRFLPNYLELSAKVLDEDPSVGIAYTDYYLFGEQAKQVYDSHKENRRGKIENGFYYINFPEFDLDEMKIGHNFIHGSSMYRRAAYEQVGGYKNQKAAPEDYNLFLRIVTSGWTARKVHGTYLEYRQHSSEQANRKVVEKAQLEYYKERLAYFEKEAKDLNEHWVRDVNELRAEIDRLTSLIADKDRMIAEKDQVILSLQNQSALTFLRRKLKK